MKVCQQCQREYCEEDLYCSECGSELEAVPPLPLPADSSPREVLRFLVQKHPKCVKNYSLLNCLLSCYLVKAEAEGFLIGLAAVKGIPECLQEAQEHSAVLLDSLAERLTKQCFIQPEMAREGVLIWAYALGLQVNDVSGQQSVPHSLGFVSQPGQVVKAGQVLTLALPSGLELELVWCPPGTFLMGSPEEEPGRNEYLYCDEAQHRVTLNRGFWMGKYAVTQEQYEAVMRDNPSSFRGKRRPVECVSWEDAMDFGSRVQVSLNGKLPKDYQLILPTEAQWEYACRAETSRALHNGQELASEYAACANLEKLGWYENNSQGETHEVGHKSPNAWGLYDMHGNVWEWCRDWYDCYTGAAIEPTGPEFGTYRVCRGGSWRDYARSCRSAYRHGSLPTNHIYDNLGFRLVLTQL